MIYLKLIAGGLVLAALVALGVTVNGWRKDAAQVPVLEQRIEQANAQIALERKQREDANAASKGYQDELKNLRAARAAAGPARSVRLCNVPARAAGAVSRAGEPGPDATAAGTGELSQTPGRDPEPGPDIGADLFAEADRADDIVAQCRGLQDLESRRSATAAPP